MPGALDACYILLSRWGTKSLREVLAPAMDLAERGFALTPGQAHSFNSRSLSKYPTTSRVYQPGGKQWRAGEIFRNPVLARTFRRLVEAEAAAGGDRNAGLKAARDRFYKGDIAREIRDFSSRNGGLLRYEDLAAYSARVEQTVSYTYHGYTVHKNPSASQGPAELFALNILSGYDLRTMGAGSADYRHTLAEAVKLAMADREKYLGDMDFIKVPYRGLLSPEYAAERRKLIDPHRASLDLRAGDAEKYEPDFQPVTRPPDFEVGGDGDHNGDTSFIAVVDRDRNAVAFESSLHSGLGTKMILGELGFTLNCRGDYFSLVRGHANALAPGKRPQKHAAINCCNQRQRTVSRSGMSGRR